MIKEALYSLIKNNAGIAAIVGTRVYTNILPQNCTLPAVSFSRISGSKGLMHSGDTKIVDGTYQVDAWSKTALEVESLALAIKRCLHGYSGTIGSDEVLLCSLINEVDLGPDPELFEYHVALDFNVRFRES